jgi:hypothetical protein
MVQYLPLGTHASAMRRRGFTVLSLPLPPNRRDLLFYGFTKDHDHGKAPTTSATLTEAFTQSPYHMGPVFSGHP